MFAALVCPIRALILDPPFHFVPQPDVPVVMPVDHAEIRRVGGQYELIKFVTGNNYFHEVDDLLRSPGGDTKRVLDIVSNSPWCEPPSDSRRIDSH